MTKTKGEKINTIKYEKPKIVLFDLKNSDAELFKQYGNNISTGSLGYPYKVEKSSYHSPVFRIKDIPENFIENEILIFDFQHKQFLDAPIGKKIEPNDELDFWSKNNLGYIDPRPINAMAIQDSIEKILKNGGIAIIFAAPDIQNEYSYGKATEFNHFVTNRELYISIWDIISILDNLEVVKEKGTELTLGNNVSTLENLLSKHFINSNYLCHFKLNKFLENKWWTLISNKFGEPISGIIALGDKIEEGLIYIFPQLQNKGVFLSEFINNYLPTVKPDSFPYHNINSWIHESEYEIPSVIKLQKKINEIEKSTKDKIELIEQQVIVERNKFNYLHSVLTETGNSLVNSIISIFKILGFKDVINVDIDKGNNLREDIQIRDSSPLILAEVKGITNLPKEEDSLQVFKYLAPRMQKLQRFDIKGLSIINHQKNIAPLKRENKNVFQKDVITNAVNSKIGLLTTWDLYRLARNYLKLNWKHKNIKDLFYSNGRINPVPTNYEYIGKVEKIWIDKNVIGIIINDIKIKVGDLISIEHEIDFEETEIISLEFEGNEIEVSKENSRIGIKLKANINKCKKNERVYLIS